MSNNPVVRPRSKHIEIDIHFIRDHVDRGAISVQYISSSEQRADIFTKSLPSQRFETLSSRLNVRSLPLSLRGHIDTIS